MSNKFVLYSVLASALTVQVAIQSPTADASPVTTADLKLVGFVESEPFPNTLVLPQLNINSPALYRVEQRLSEGDSLEIISTVTETSGPGSGNGLDYTELFELNDGYLAFDPGASAPEGLLYPHYMIINFFFDFDGGEEEFEGEDSFAALFDENPEIFPGGPVFEITGCNPGPCNILFVELLTNGLEDNVIPTGLTISVYNSAVIPLPPAALLFGSALAAVAFGARRRKAAA